MHNSVKVIFLTVDFSIIFAYYSMSLKNTLHNLNKAANDYLLRQGKPNLHGYIRTPVEGVKLFRDPLGTAPQPLLYQSGIIVMLQGKKHLYFENQTISYERGDYVVVGMPIPAMCAAIPEENEAILGLLIDIPASVLSDLNHWRTTPYSEKYERCTLSKQSLDLPIADAVHRLTSAFSSPKQAEALSAGYIREIIFHIVNGPAGHTLSGLTDTGHYAKIANALQIIHAHYAGVIQVEQLAADVNMSVSGFHRAFREVVLDTPVQYVKKVRLAKARELIAAGKRVGDAADAVGYKSLSQFSREFKRYYQLSPAKDKNTVA